MSEFPPTDIEGHEAVNRTIASRVAAELRLRILHGQIEPGSRLKLEELSSQLDVSHMPVREALRELEGEGLLELYPHRGAVIKGVDAQFVRNLYDVRGAIEGMLTERCAEIVDPAGVRELNELVEAHAAAAAARDSDALLVTNRRLHDAINGWADNPEALHMLARGRVLVDALRLRYGFGSGRVEAVVAEHRTLLRAIERRDAERAGGIARRHCMRARDDLLARMRQGHGSQGSGSGA
ncbi:MAG: GntR family transcriptional regulator [Betaproteobacteria bacterium]